MKEENIRSLHIPISQNLLTKHKQLLVNTAMQAAQAYSLLSELAREKRECCHFTLLGELNGLDVVSHLNLLDKKLIYPIARRACRHLFAKRSSGVSYGDEEIGFPVRDNVLKFQGDFIKLKLPTEDVFCRYTYPSRFASRYKFKIKEFLFGDVVIRNALYKMKTPTCGEIYLRLGYAVEEVDEVLPLFKFAKPKRVFPSPY